MLTINNILNQLASELSQLASSERYYIDCRRADQAKLRDLLDLTDGQADSADEKKIQDLTRNLKHASERLQSVRKEIKQARAFFAQLTTRAN